MAHPERASPALADAPVPIAQVSAPPRSAAVASWVLVALAVLSPWAMGAVTPAGVQAVSTLSLTAALAVAAHQAWRGAICLPRAPLWPVLLLIAVGVGQLVPMPATWHALLAPGSAAVWHPADPIAAAYVGTRPRPISIHPTATATWVGLTVGLCSLGLLAAPAFARHHRVIRMAWLLVAAGTAVAVYGIVARALFGPLLYGSIAVPTVAPFGPFVNKNHFAGYVEMPALLALGLGRGLWRQSASAGQSGVETIRPAVLVAFGAAAVMVMAVLLSLSRGGALGLFAGIATFVIVDITTSRHRRPLTKFVAPVGLGVLLLVILALLPGEVHDRLFGTEWRGDRSALFRFGTWRDALRAFAASPIVGQGLGAFTDILPRYKTAAGAFRVEHPENEVLEIAVEGGLLALGAAATAIVVGLWRVVRQIRGHHDRAARGIVSGAVAAVVALVVHGFVDFNLRIPSNAAMFVAVAALAIAPLGTAPRAGPIRWGVIALLLGAGVLYSRASDAAPVLADARAMAMKAYSPTGDEGRRLRAALADRRAREYVSRRPADPEGWLLAAWTSVMTGQRQNVDALARHAVALDPQRPAVTVAARPFMEVSPAPR